MKNSHPLKLAGALLIGLGLGGCNPPVIQEWSGIEQPVRLNVQNLQLRQSVAFVAGSDRVRARDSDALRAFVARQRPEPRDVVVIAQAPPQGQRGAAVADARVRAISDALSESGSRMLDLRQTYDPMIPANTAEVRVARAVVQLPACGDWTRPPNANYANGPGANFGCATAYNLGAMVADPSDLVGGRNLGPAFGEHQVPALQRYNRGQVTPLPDSSTSSLGGGGSAAPTASTPGAQQ